MKKKRVFTRMLYKFKNNVRILGRRFSSENNAFINSLVNYCLENLVVSVQAVDSTGSRIFEAWTDQFLQIKVNGRSTEEAISNLKSTLRSNEAFRLKCFLL